MPSSHLGLMSWIRFGAAGAAATLLALTLPAAAGANATVTRDGSDVITITSTAAENNDIVVHEAAGNLRVQEQGAVVAGLDAGSGCATVSQSVVECGASASALRIVANLGPGNDIV